jgi:mRNA-degrading endonuclease RelE of RelBE toxin-antitoxin system
MPDLKNKYRNAVYCAILAYKSDNEWKRCGMQKLLKIVETKSYLDKLAYLVNKGQDESILRTSIKKMISLNPSIGSIIPRTGGIRKFRYPMNGKGKRGSYRVIYYYYNDEHPVYLLTIYSKSKSVNLTVKDE